MKLIFDNGHLKMKASASSMTDFAIGEVYFIKSGDKFTHTIMKKRLDFSDFYDIIKIN